ncbi:MAG: hypothetical protein RR150_12625, partial [Clostridia bacterium]
MRRFTTDIKIFIEFSQFMSGLGNLITYISEGQSGMTHALDKREGENDMKRMARVSVWVLCA